MKALTTTDLDKGMRHIVDFKGAHPCDMIPRGLKPPYSIIINTDNGSKPGEHWIALRVVKGKVYFLDSFGRRFDDESFPADFRRIINRMTRRKDVIFNNKLIQNITSNACGYYAIYFLDGMSMKKRPKRLLKTFTKDLKKNDAIVVKYYRKFFK